MTRATPSARTVLAISVGLPLIAMLLVTVAPVVGGRIGGPPAGWSLRNAASGLCLGVDDVGSPALAPCTGEEAQLWRRLAGTAGTVSLRNAGTGRCLAAVAGGVSAPFCVAGDRAQALAAAGQEGYAAADGSGCLAGIQWYSGGGRRAGAVLVAACGRNDMQRWRLG
jgi:Ricin-type beta-trefoil lectin domain-like